MALAEITQAIHKAQPLSLRLYAVDGATVYVRKPDGSEEPVYATSAGGTPVTQPLTSQNGRIEGWVEEGRHMDLVVSKPGEIVGYTQRIVSGGGPIGPAGPAGPAGSAGEVTHAMMARGAFHVYRNAAWSIPHAAFTAIPFDTKLFDLSNAYDVANARFVAPVAGIYRFTAGMQLDQSTAAGVLMVLDLSPRHVQLDRRWPGAASISHGVWGSGLAQLAAGATLQVNGYHEAGAARNVQVGQAYTFFQGELVAAT